MRTKRLSVWFIFLVAIGVILGFSTWHQWRGNQTTTLERMRPIAPIVEVSHGASIIDIVFSPANQGLIATAGRDNYIKIWNRNNPDNPTEIQFNHEESLFSIEYLKKGNFLLCNGLHRKKVLWNASSGEKVYFPEGELQGDSDISPSADNMATIHPRRLVLWNIKNPNEPTITTEITEVHHTKYINSMRCVDFSPNGKWLALGYENGDIRLWDLEQGKFMKTLSVSPDSHVGLRDIDYSPDGRWIIARESHSLSIWDTDNNLRSVLLESYQGFLREVKFSQDGRFIGIKTHDGMGGYILWSLPDVLIYHQMSYQQVDEGIISSIAFSPDGAILAVSNPGEVTLISIETLSPIVVLKGEGFFGGAHEITFSSDGTMLAGGETGGVLRLWDVSEYYEE